MTGYVCINEWDETVVLPELEDIEEVNSLDACIDDRAKFWYSGNAVDCTQIACADCTHSNHCYVR